MHLFNGQVPVRSQETLNTGQSMIPGTSTTLWTETHPYQDLPRSIQRGWLQNANDPPWTTTFPLALDQMTIRLIWHRVDR